MSNAEEGEPSGNPQEGGELEVAAPHIAPPDQAVGADLASSAQMKLAGSVQGMLFNRKALLEFCPSVPTADALGEVEADDHARYFVKGDSHGRAVRASEWIASHLAEGVHINAPPYAVIEMMDGRLVFGSRSISGVKLQAETVHFLTKQSVGGSNSASVNTAQISAIYAFDMFINNYDRHLGNYLSIDDHGRQRLIAFDYSRSMFWNWPWPSPSALQCNTVQCGRLLRGLHGFDHSAAMQTIDRLESINAPMVESYFERMPAEWLPESLKVNFIEWWGSSGKSDRLARLRAGISDGTLL